MDNYREAEGCLSSMGTLSLPFSSRSGVQHAAEQAFIATTFASILMAFTTRSAMRTSRLAHDQWGDVTSPVVQQAHYNRPIVAECPPSLSVNSCRKDFWK